MLIPVGYDRFRAVAYALRWALSRNPRYYDFEDIGGDCTLSLIHISEPTRP